VNNFDKIFKEKFSTHRIVPDPALWAGISQKLPEKSKPVYQKHWLLIMALFGLVAGYLIGVNKFDDSKDTFYYNNKNIPHIENKLNNELMQSQQVYSSASIQKITIEDIHPESSGHKNVISKDQPQNFKNEKLLYHGSNDVSKPKNTNNEVLVANIDIDANTKENAEIVEAIIVENITVIPYAETNLQSVSKILAMPGKPVISKESTSNQENKSSLLIAVIKEGPDLVSETFMEVKEDLGLEGETLPEKLVNAGGKGFGRLVRNISENKTVQNLAAITR
jgi:hypothetical protein